jgi:hypothetical protein
MYKKRLLNEADFRLEAMQFGRVDQSGMIATLASWRSWVQIPARPPNTNSISRRKLFPKP